MNDTSQLGMFGDDSDDESVLSDDESVLRHRRELRAEEAKWCPCCEQKIRNINPHRMDASKVDILERVARMNIAGHEWVKLQRDGHLIHPDARDWSIQCDDVHGLRLMWFGLMVRKRIKTGLYRVTADGLRFLRGEHRVPKKILCKGGDVIERSDELVDVASVRNVILDRAYWDAYPSEQVSVWDIDRNTGGAE